MKHLILATLIYIIGGQVFANDPSDKPSKKETSNTEFAAVKLNHQELVSAIRENLTWENQFTQEELIQDMLLETHSIETGVNLHHAEEIFVYGGQSSLLLGYQNVESGKIESDLIPKNAELLMQDGNAFYYIIPNK